MDHFWNVPIHMKQKANLIWIIVLATHRWWKCLFTNDNYTICEVLEQILNISKA